MVSMSCETRAPTCISLPVLASAIRAPALSERIGMLALPGLPPLPARGRPGRPDLRAAQRRAANAARRESTRLNRSSYTPRDAVANSADRAAIAARSASFNSAAARTR